jgi:pheromone shutdown protein TraB
MQPAILDFRYRALAQRIMQSPDDRICIIYGAAHLPGLVAELRKLDSKWAVGSVK